MPSSGGLCGSLRSFVHSSTLRTSRTARWAKVTEPLSEAPLQRVACTALAGVTPGGNRCPECLLEEPYCGRRLEAHLKWWPPDRGPAEPLVPLPGLLERWTTAAEAA